MERSEHWLEYVKISELIKASNNKGKENVSTVWNFPPLVPPTRSFLSGREVVKLQIYWEGQGMDNGAASFE